MLIEWMAYSVLFTVLISIGALAIERVAAIWGSARRFVWLTALALGALTPLWLAFGASSGPDTQGRVSVSTVTPTSMLELKPPAPQTPQVSVSLKPRLRSILAASEAYIPFAWLGASLILLGLFARASMSIARRRRRWPEVRLDGARVFVSPDAGPAVVGALRPTIVVPQWALSLDARSRELMLRHEAEHIDARDPSLLLIAVLALIAFPWNAALWLIAQRLRLAIEVDCDRRVLRASSDQREYGMLLLAVGARRSAPLPFAASLAARRPFLELRIRAMTERRPRAPRLASLGLVAIAVGATTAATRAPRPSPIVVRGARPSSENSPTPVSPSGQPVSQPVVDSTARIIVREVPSPRPVPMSEATPQPRQYYSAPIAMPPVRESVTREPSETSPPLRRSGPVSLAVIRAWIAEHHPTVFDGDTTINVVTILLDANKNYVSSKAGRLPPPKTAQVNVLDARTGRVEPVVSAEDTTTISRPKVVIDGQEFVPIAIGRALADNYLVAKDSIASVEVIKYRPGVMGPGHFSVVLVTLK